MSLVRSDISQNFSSFCFFLSVLVFKIFICLEYYSLLLSLTWSLPDVAETEVSCVFMERCILPCSFQVAPDFTISWVQLTDIHVHFYNDNQDQLGYQNQTYRNRTSLFKEQISRGNASLQLTGVKVQDEGRYECFISTNNGNTVSFINVKVYGMRQIQKTIKYLVCGAAVLQFVL
uniref:Ig-like domain-containing protein n=1 Tax=Acanthochromis polyacanthus TaxID=80966 RepID=A0A3Q1GIK6_9TELE